MTEEFNDRIGRYFRTRLDWSEAKVLRASRLTGGISRETWMVELETKAADGTAASRSIVLRLDPATSLLDSNRNIEYAMFRAFAGVQDVPVPQAICNEDDASHLGASFMALAALPGVASIAAVMQPPFASVGRQIAQAHFNVLGAIARFDYQRRQLDCVMKEPTTQSAALDILLHWERVFREHSLGPAPITEAAIRYLKRRPPTAPCIAVVHGDYRLGNCLFLPDGTISGVLDWEMTHLGDPTEDLAWAMHPAWRPSASPKHLVAGYLTEEESIHSWEQASRIQVDREALRWWRLFSCVKTTALFTTGGYNFLKRPGSEMVYALSAWNSLDGEEAQMLQWLGVSA